MYRIGIDIGGTSIALGLLKNDRDIIQKKSIKTPLKCNADKFCDCIALSIENLLIESNVRIDEVSHIGVGYPGTVDNLKGVLYYANNIGLDRVPLKEMLKKRYPSIDVRIENDANAAAFGEFMLGTLKDSDDAIAITIGTGVGGGIIINKKIYTGFNFSAGEFGHHVLVADGKECSCGRRGCFEAYCSANALIERTKERAEDHKESLLWKLSDGQINDVNGEIIFRAIHENDKIAKEIFKQYIYYLGMGVANIINIFQPEKLCIGGGISAQGDFLLNPLKEVIEKNVYTTDEKTKVYCAQLGNDAGIIGAALLSKQYER